MQSSDTPKIRHNSYADANLTLNTEMTSSKRKRSEADLAAEAITLTNPIWAAAEKGTIGQHIHTSETALQLVGGLGGALSKDMARVHLTVHALRCAVQKLEIRKRERNGRLRPAHQIDLENLKKRLMAAERRERRQKSKEEDALEKMLMALQTPGTANAKRIKSSVPVFREIKPKQMAGSFVRAREDDVELIEGVSQSQDGVEATEAHGISETPQQGFDGAIGARKTVVTTTKGDPDGQAQSFAKSHPRDNPAEKSKEEPAKPEKPWFGFADFQAKIKEDEDLLLQKYEEKPRGMTLSAWCTEQGLPKRRPAGRGPFPVETRGLKRSLVATYTGTFDIEEQAEINNKKQKLETNVSEQLSSIKQKVAKPKGPSQSDFLRRHSIEKAISKRLTTQAGDSSAKSSALGIRRHEAIDVKVALESSLIHGDSGATDEMNVSIKKMDDPSCSSSSFPSLEKENPKLSFAEATASRQRQAFTFQGPYDYDIPAANAVPNKIKPQPQILMHPFPSQSPPLPTADKNSRTKSWDSDEETLYEGDLVIPLIGTKDYDRYVDSRLEEYCAAKEIEAKRNQDVVKMPSDEVMRTVSSKTLVDYTASLLAYQQDRIRRSKLHERNIEDLTEEEFAITSAPRPKRPVLPPTVGHEIAAKVHLEGTWSHVKHRFRVVAKSNGKIESFWKSPKSRPPPPSHRSSASYEKLKGR